MSFFNNKKILILSVYFFNYEKLIKDELTSMGAIVDLFNERPSNSFFSKAIIRWKKGLYKRNIEKYYNKIIKKIFKKKYDYFLLIKGEVVPYFFIEFLKINNPNIILIYYTYDSFKNNPNGLNMLSFFDKKYTFDRKDANMYNISFRPLFFAPDYESIYNNNSFDFDLSFIGTAHSDRYQISQFIDNWCKIFGFKMHNFYFSPSRILFIFKKLTDRKFKSFDIGKISYKCLSHQEIITIYKKTKVILDINHPGQNGLTMRTFETLGAGRKLITTNQDIKSYPFYNKNNILVIERENPNLECEFFTNEFQKIENKIYFSMSLKGWLEELFEKESNIWQK